MGNTCFLAKSVSLRRWLTCGMGLPNGTGTRSLWCTRSGAGGPSDLNVEQIEVKLLPASPALAASWQSAH